jgi:hypothetical protein
MYLDEFPIHTHLCWYKENSIAMKRFTKKCMKNLEIHWRATNVGVFENTENISKIRLWLKDK